MTLVIHYMNNPPYEGRELPPGPWDNEPDKVQWYDEPSGYDCLVLRGPMGAWCGYVALEPDHPYYGKHYEEAPVEVHGGLTFADFCMEDGRPQGERVCHIERHPGVKVWWLGFDCGHHMDLVPGMTPMAATLNSLTESFGAGDEQYRDLDYVTRETVGLAVQLRALAIARDVRAE